MIEADQVKPSNFKETYKKSVSRKVTFIIICAVLCVALSLYSATIGTYEISFQQVYQTIWNFLTGVPQDANLEHIVINLRLPRIVGALICGFGLAICGAAMQSMMKNPLADPYTMGISSGAGFGASVAIILGIELIAGGGVVVNAFIFATIPALVILFLSKVRKATPTMMILCGTSLMYLFNALTQLFMLIADPDDMETVYKWMVGSLDKVSYQSMLLVMIITILGSLYVQYMANQLNIMGVGDESAKTLGVNVDRQRLIILIVITLVAASVVSFTGIIGFVGLVAPHIVRTIIGSDNKYLIPASGLFGSLLLLASDMVARTVAAPLMLPVGVVTACIGGPLFMYLILRNNKETWS